MKKLNPIVLVADDEPDLADTLEFLLQSDGLDVIVARNGLEALGAARQYQPRVILMDVMMPRENGYRVARTIREDEAKGLLPERTKIFLLTARNLSDDKERETMFMEFSGADGVVYKPFEANHLLDMVQAAMASFDAPPLEADLPRDEVRAACR